VIIKGRSKCQAFALLFWVRPGILHYGNKINWLTVILSLKPRADPKSIRGSGWAENFTTRWEVQAGVAEN
jgi:hypothetical protein